MENVIKSLEERDDVAKTTFKQRRADDGYVMVEMWHDTDALQRIMENAINGASLSQKGIQHFAENEALVTRETTVGAEVYMRNLYPNVIEHLDEQNEDESE